MKFMRDEINMKLLLSANCYSLGVWGGEGAAEKEEKALDGASRRMKRTAVMGGGESKKDR